MNMKRLVDYHCHLDLYPQHNAAYNACRNEAVEVLAVTTTPRAWAANLELARHAPNIRVGLGLHPQLVGTKEADMELFENLAPNAKFIGEVGLDAGPRFYKTMELQKQLFAKILQISARTGPKILSVHSIRSAGLVLSMIESHLKGSGCQVVLHWFSGSVSDARRAVAMGCWFSINSQMRRSAGAQKLMDAIPLNRMLTETDGPFTEAAPGVANAPAQVSEAVQMIADTKKQDSDDVLDLVLKNLKSLESILMK